MTVPDKNEIYATFVDVIADTVLQYIECDELTGQLIEEAVLEALEYNASYFTALSVTSSRILNEYKDYRNSSQKKTTKCFAECDI